MRTKLMALLVCGVCAGNVMAQSSAPQGSAPPPPPHGRNAALDAAISECASSVAKDAQGRPERTAMDACMSAKGFKKPPHHGGGDRPPPPPSGSTSSSSGPSGQ